MKTIEYYMSLPYRLEILPDPDEGGYVARYPDLPGCITNGDSMESVAENAEDAKREWLAAAMENGTYNIQLFSCADSSTTFSNLSHLDTCISCFYYDWCRIWCQS